MNVGNTLLQRIPLKHKSHRIPFGLVGLGDVSTRELRQCIVGCGNLGDIYPIATGLDFFLKHIQTLVIIIDDHFTINCSGGIIPHPTRQVVAKIISYQGRIKTKSVENPVIFGGHTQQANIVVAHQVRFHGSKSILFLRQGLGRRPPDLDHDLAIVIQAGCTVLVGQIVAVSCPVENYFHRGWNFWSIRNLNSQICADDDNRQIAVGKNLGKGLYTEENY